MKFSFFISTFGGSPLQVGLDRGLSAMGHTVSYYRNGCPEDFDFLVIFNQVSHIQSYAFPDFPKSPNIPVIFVDAAEYGYFRRLPSVAAFYANAFSPSAMSHDTKSIHEQTRLKEYLTGRSFPYFIREFSKYLHYPENYHPIDYPLYAHSVPTQRPDKASYLNRKCPLFLSWGASHPWRWDITRALRSAPYPCDVRVIEENGTPRMRQREYFDRIAAARMSVSFDGYGSSSFRMTEVLTRTLLLQGPLTMRMREPLVDGETCRMFGLTTSGQDCLDTDIIQVVIKAMENPEDSYRIFENGYNHCMEHYTEEATARYLVGVVERHDWKYPTEVDL